MCAPPKVSTHPDGREKYVKAVLVMVTRAGRLAVRDMASQMDYFESSCTVINDDDNNDE